MGSECTICGTEHPTGCYLHNRLTLAIQAIEAALQLLDSADLSSDPDAQANYCDRARTNLADVLEKLQEHQPKGS